MSTSASATEPPGLRHSQHHGAPLWIPTMFRGRMQGMWERKFRNTIDYGGPTVLIEAVLATARSELRKMVHAGSVSPSRNV